MPAGSPSCSPGSVLLASPAAWHPRLSPFNGCRAGKRFAATFAMRAPERHLDLNAVPSNVRHEPFQFVALPAMAVLQFEHRPNLHPQRLPGCIPEIAPAVSDWKEGCPYRAPPLPKVGVVCVDVCVCVTNGYHSTFDYVCGCLQNTHTPMSAAYRWLNLISDVRRL